MMTRGREGVWIPPKSDDVIYEQPLMQDIWKESSAVIMQDIWKKSCKFCDLCATGRPHCMAASTSSPLLPLVSGKTRRANADPAAAQIAKPEKTAGLPRATSSRGKA